MSSRRAFSVPGGEHSGIGVVEGVAPGVGEGVTPDVAGGELWMDSAPLPLSWLRMRSRRSRKATLRCRRRRISCRMTNISLWWWMFRSLSVLLAQQFHATRVEVSEPPVASVSALCFGEGDPRHIIARWVDGLAEHPVQWGRKRDVERAHPLVL